MWTAAVLWTAYIVLLIVVTVFIAMWFPHWPRMLALWIASFVGVLFVLTMLNSVSIVVNNTDTEKDQNTVLIYFLLISSLIVLAFLTLWSAYVYYEDGSLYCRV
jgi:hypothetical protein